jgi:hypothetical protein
MKIKVSKAFLADREDRDLPVGLVYSFAGNKAIIEGDGELLADIRADAAYQGWFTDCSSPGLVRAARTAFRDLGKAGVLYGPGERVNRKSGLVEPRDA